MCQVIHMPDGDTIETMGELRRLWPKGLVALDFYGVDNINDPASDGPGTDDSGTCICPVDVEASARLNGMRAVEIGGGEWGVVPWP